MRSFLKGIILTLAVAVAPLQIAIAQSSSDTSGFFKQQVTTNFTLEAGSAEAIALTQWLELNSPTEGGVLLVDLENIGNIHVSHTAVVGGAGPLNEPPPPPYMPPQGNPGDTYSVSTCSNNVSQSWEFEWVGSSTDGGWVNTSYTRELVVECSSL